MNFEELAAQLLQQSALQKKAESDAKHAAALQTILAGDVSSEADMYRQGDAQREAQAKARETEIAARRAMGLPGDPRAPLAHQNAPSLGPGAFSNAPGAAVPRSERIDALGGMQDWTSPEAQTIMPSMRADDLKIAKQRKDSGVPPVVNDPKGAIPYQSYYGVGKDSLGNDEVQSFRPDMQFGTTDDQDYRGMNVSGDSMVPLTKVDKDGRAIPKGTSGNPITPYDAPVPLHEQLRGMSEDEARDTIIRRMQRLQHLLSNDTNPYFDPSPQAST